MVKYFNKPITRYEIVKLDESNVYDYIRYSVEHVDAETTYDPQKLVQSAIWRLGAHDNEAKKQLTKLGLKIVPIDT